MAPGTTRCPNPLESRFPVTWTPRLRPRQQDRAGRSAHGPSLVAEVKNYRCGERKTAPGMRLSWQVVPRRVPWSLHVRGLPMCLLPSPELLPDTPAPAYERPGHPRPEERSGPTGDGHCGRISSQSPCGSPGPGLWVLLVPSLPRVRAGVQRISESVSSVSVQCRQRGTQNPMWHVGTSW